MSRIMQVILLIVIAGIVLFSPVIASKYVSVPFWLREGTYALYKVHIYKIMFLNNTQICFESPIGEGSYLLWRILDLNNTHATFEVLLNIELRNTKIKVIRNFSLKDSEERIYTSGFIRIESQAIVNILTREVFVNGEKVGSTGLWIPSNLLFNGIKVRVGEVYEGINIRGVLRGPCVIKTSSGCVYAYIYEFDKEDELTIYRYEIELTNVKIGKIYGNICKVINITYDPEENITFIHLQYINTHKGITIGRKGYWLNNLTNLGVFVITGYKGNALQSSYCYDPISGLAVKASFFIAGGEKPREMMCGDGLTAALRIKVFEARIELTKTNIPLLTDEIMWRMKFFGISVISIVFFSLTSCKKKNGKSMMN